MKIQLNTEELNQLVLDHINSLGISTDNFDVDMRYSIDGCAIGLNKKETNKEKPTKKKKEVMEEEVVDEPTPFSEPVEEDTTNNESTEENPHSLFG